jgi:hypothetical protein
MMTARPSALLRIRAHKSDDRRCARRCWRTPRWGRRPRSPGTTGCAGTGGCRTATGYPVSALSRSSSQPSQNARVTMGLPPGSGPARRRRTVRVGAVFHPTRAHRREGVVPGGRGRAGHRRDDPDRHGRDHPPPAVHARPSAHHPGGNHPRPPRPRPRTPAEADFLRLGDGAHAGQDHGVALLLSPGVEPRERNGQEPDPQAAPLHRGQGGR